MVLHPSSRTLRRTALVGLATAWLAGLAGTALAAPASPAPTCFDPTALAAVQRLDAHALDVQAGGKHYRLSLAPDCAGLGAGEEIRVASTSGPVCADGNAAAITASAICPVVGVRAIASPEQRCFRIRDVRGFAVLRDNRVGIDLRGGQKRVLVLEAACPQLDRIDDIGLVSGARDGRICGHPQDAVLPMMGDAMAFGIARQVSANDFQPCRIADVQPGTLPRTTPAPGGDAGERAGD